jgi:hypothetical protein
MHHRFVVWSFISRSDGFGFLPTYIRFDPTDGILEIFGEKMGLQSIKESVPNGIEDQFVEFFNKH